MANKESNFKHPDFTGLAAECFSTFIHSYDPLRIIGLCMLVQELELERDNLKKLLQIALNHRKEMLPND